MPDSIPTAPKFQPGQEETPEDIAALYSWANLHGAKYRDFSSSRAQAREEARAARERHTHENAEQEEQEQIQLAALLAAETAAAERQAEATYTPAPPAAPAPQPSVAASSQAAPTGWHQDRALIDPLIDQPRNPAPPQSISQPSEPSPQVLTPYNSARESLPTPLENPSSRWFALKSVFDAGLTPVKQEQAPQSSHVPVLALFSLAGGVGKTSITATLGRVFSSLGEHVLLIDTTAFGLLPFFFGARDQRHGILRTFNPPGGGGEAPIQLVTLDPGSQISNPPPDPGHSQDQDQQDWLTQQVTRFTGGANRVLVDLPTASSAAARSILRLSPEILVPVVPDMSSVISVHSIEAFFRNSQDSGSQIMPWYVLNRFDPSLPLHREVRELLSQQLGNRLLPFVLRRSPAVSEALAEGMTVMDYASASAAAEDYATLAGWVRSLDVPAGIPNRGARWSER